MVRARQGLSTKPKCELGPPPAPVMAEWNKLAVRMGGLRAPVTMQVLQHVLRKVHMPFTLPLAYVRSRL